MMGSRLGEASGRSSRPLRSRSAREPFSAYSMMHQVSSSCMPLGLTAQRARPSARW